MESPRFVIEFEFSLQQVIHIIKMKKYGYQAAMNSIEVASVIKRHRNARKASFSEQDQVLHLAKVLESVDGLKVL